MPMKTTTVDHKMLAEAMDTLRAAGASDDLLAQYSVALDDFAITQGNTEAELTELRATVPDVTVIEWKAMHRRIDLTV